MLRIITFLIKTVIVVGIFLTAGAEIYHYGGSLPFPSIKIFEPKTILNVTEVGKLGSIYVAKRFKLKDDNSMVVERMQGSQIDTLETVGEPQKIYLTKNQKITLADIATLILPLHPRPAKNHHYISVQVNNGSFITTTPEDQACASVLSRTLDRFSSETK